MHTVEIPLLPQKLKTRKCVFWPWILICCVIVLVFGAKTWITKEPMLADYSLEHIHALVNRNYAWNDMLESSVGTVTLKEQLEQDLQRRKAAGSTGPTNGVSNMADQLKQEVERRQATGPTGGSNVQNPVEDEIPRLDSHGQIIEGIGQLKLRDPKNCGYAALQPDWTSETVTANEYHPTPQIVQKEEDIDRDHKFSTQQAKANEWLPPFMQRVLIASLDRVKKTMGDQATAGCIVSPGPPKSQDRVLQKAINDYGGDMMKVMDVARVTVVCEDVTYLLNALKVLYLLTYGEKDDTFIIRIKNKGFGDKFPEGFTMTKMADITVNLHAPGSDWAVEVQFQLLPILLKKSNLHEIYDHFRVLDNPLPEQCYAFMVNSQAIMGRAWKSSVEDHKREVQEIADFIAQVQGCCEQCAQQNAKSTPEVCEALLQEIRDKGPVMNSENK